jgi:hypothetical protein
MRVVFLKDGETIGIGRHLKGEERDVPGDVARVLAKRGVASQVCVEESSELISKGEAADGRE